MVKQAVSKMDFSEPHYSLRPLKIGFWSRSHVTRREAKKLREEQEAGEG